MFDLMFKKTFAVLLACLVGMAILPQASWSAAVDPDFVDPAAVDADLVDPATVPHANYSETTTLDLGDAQLHGVANTLVAYPKNAPQILQNYLNIDTTKVDFNKFADLLASKDTPKVYDEVKFLYNNRQAFNTGSLTSAAYYKAPVPGAVPPIAGSASSSISAAGFYTGLGVVAAAGTAIAVGSSGGGGSSSDDGSSGSGQDVFNRAALPDTATPASFVDTEFNAYNLNALGRENAQYAYAKGLTGAGVKIGFHDFFSTDASADSELSSRVVYRNLNIPYDMEFMYNNCTLSGGQKAPCDHGNVVMAYAANARDGSGTQGVAPGATLLMNSVFADPNSTSTVRLLSDNGANIINFSCTGCASLADVQYLAAAGRLMTAATGNDGLANPQYAPASYATQLDYTMIAVTGVYTQNNALTNAAYNKCGTAREFCMAAYSDQGTSFAAPQIAGAAALIKDGWSYLTAKQIGQILLYSAKDIGAPGVDVLYGHGLLDLKAAIAPVGSVTVASASGNRVAFAPSVIAQNARTAFGDAFASDKNAHGNVTVVDSFGRDFAVKTQDNLIVAKQQNLSADSVSALGRTNAVSKMKFSDDLSMNFSEAQNGSGNSKIVAAFADYEITPAAHMTMAFANDINSLATDDDTAFNRNDFIASDVLKNGFLNFSANNQVYAQGMELAAGKNLKTKFSTYYATNDARDYFNMDNSNQIKNDYTSSMLETVYTPTEKSRLNFKNGVTHEFDSVLGSRFSGSFDMRNGADTYFTGLDAGYNVTDTINLLGSYQMGSTQAKPGAASAFTDIGNIVSNSFAVTATKRDLLGHDKLGLSVGQPMRVRSGVATGVSQTVDRSTGALGMTQFEQNLVPTGRTLMFQAAYQKSLSDTINMNLAFEYTSQPYQQLNAPDEASVLAKMTYKFN